MDKISEFTNADLVRGLEDLEHKHRILVRYTHEGNDYVALTSVGAKIAGVSEFIPEPPHVPHPPKSST